MDPFLQEHQEVRPSASLELVSLSLQVELNHAHFVRAGFGRGNSGTLPGRPSPGGSAPPVNRPNSAGLPNSWPDNALS